MQKDLIRTDEERAARLQLVKANRIQRQEKLLAVSLSSPSAVPLPKPNHRVSHDVSVIETNSTRIEHLFSSVVSIELSST